MVKSSFDEGFDSGRFIVSTTVTPQGDSYLCKGRIVQGRGIAEEDGEVNWEDKLVELEFIGTDPSEIQSFVLERLFKYMTSHEFYLFDEEEQEE